MKLVFATQCSAPFLVGLCLAMMFQTVFVVADEKSGETKSIESEVEQLERREGYLPFYWDAREGKILVEVSRWDEDLLYIHSLATGLGSNPVGLDRGQLGQEKVVQFQRVGPKVFLVQRNLRFRAATPNVLERRAVEQSFARSILWGGEVVAETEGRALVDLTDFLLSDVHGVAQRLNASDQGNFSIDSNRSAIYLDKCRAFPENSEFEATLTFKTTKAGEYVQQTTPTPQSVTLRQHHSFIKLPDRNYRPRVYDVRSPSIFITFADYAAPLDHALQKRWITRHRLEKRNPDDEKSPPKEPIVYYVDSGAPKQIQDALIEGASWWNEAFEEAGFENAFQVRLLPADADPLDVRFNVIQWVHRSTRGWSYGSSIIDPRTGEILKGHVTLGSLRVRQDQILFKGLRQSRGTVACSCCGVVGIAEDTTLAQLDSKTSALEVALARIRQLSAHEVGHTLGFVHNFAASTYGDRASVMDYPAPRVNVAADGSLDLSDAYGVGIGAWDKVAVKFAYQEFAPASEKAELDRILREAKEAGMLFISDSDARPASAAHPLANLWDNGSDPVEELWHVLRVRDLAIQRFDPTSLPDGTTTADIAQYFTPLFLHHRYQVQAVGKMLGGYKYEYGFATEGHRKSAVTVDRQRDAMEALLETIDPKRLEIPSRVLDAISPKPYSAIRDAETFDRQTGRIFDPIAAAKAAVDMTLGEILNRERLARISLQLEGNQIQVDNFLQGVVTEVFKESGSSAIQRVINEILVEKLVSIADHPRATGDVRSGAQASLQFIASRLSANESAHAKMILRQIKQVLERPFDSPNPPDSLDIPPGSPIGN